MHNFCWCSTSNLHYRDSPSVNISFPDPERHISCWLWTHNFPMSANVTIFIFSWWLTARSFLLSLSLCRWLLGHICPLSSFKWPSRRVRTLPCQWFWWRSTFLCCLNSKACTLGNWVFFSRLAAAASHRFIIYLIIFPNTINQPPSLWYISLDSSLGTFDLSRAKLEVLIRNIFWKV